MVTTQSIAGDSTPVFINH